MLWPSLKTDVVAKISRYCPPIKFPKCCCFYLLLAPASLESEALFQLFSHVAVVVAVGVVVVAGVVGVSVAVGAVGVIWTSKTGQEQSSRLALRRK